MNLEFTGVLENPGKKFSKGPGKILGRGISQFPQREFQVRLYQWGRGLIYGGKEQLTTLVWAHKKKDKRSSQIKTRGPHILRGGTNWAKDNTWLIQTRRRGSKESLGGTIRGVTQE